MTIPTRPNRETVTVLPGFASGSPGYRAPMSEVFSEANEADRHEQEQTLDDDLAGDASPATAPLEANEADVAEQHLGVSAGDDDGYPPFDG